MSIRGGDYKWFRDALDRRDLPLVKATAAQLPRRQARGRGSMRPRLRYVKERAIERKRHLRGRKRRRKRKPIFR